MQVSDAQKLKALEDESRRLKTLLAESMQDVAALKDPWGKRIRPAASRRAVLRLTAECRFSQRWACGLVQIDFKTVRREEGLAIRLRRGRKRATGTRAPMVLPAGPSQRWSLDFVADALSWGRRFRLLSIVNDFTRETPAPVLDTSIGGQRLARKLDALIARHGRPATIASDNGT